MQYLQIVLLVIELVKIVEKLLPERNKGTEKLALVRSMVEEAVGDIQEIWPLIEKVIEVFVKLSNASGKFVK